MVHRAHVLSHVFFSYQINTKKENKKIHQKYLLHFSLHRDVRAYENFLFFYISRNFSIIFLINVYTASKYKTFSYQFNTFSSDFSLIVKKIAVILHFEMFLAAHLPKIFSRSQHFVKYLFNNLECIFAKLNNHRRLHSRSRLLLSSTVFDASFSWPEHLTISLTEFWSLLVSVTTSEWNSR